MYQFWQIHVTTWQNPWINSGKYDNKKIRNHAEDGTMYLNWGAEIVFNWRYPSCLYRRVTGRNVPGGCTFTITHWSRLENLASKSWMFSMQQSTIGKPCFLWPWCNRGWDGQPDFALLNRQLRQVGQAHLWGIIRRSGFCETFFANSHPSSSSRRKMSKFDLKDVRSLLGEQDWSLLLLQTFLILSLCFLLFLYLKRNDI